MTELSQFLVLLIAVVAGWMLGRWQKWSLRTPDTDSPEGASDYYQGLNFLLNEQPDGAIDAFVNSLDVNAETLETHLAVGGLLRRKGEVDRAIRIHQNLLARPGLVGDQLHQVHMELAQDYISAGLFDRAERMLRDLMQQSPSWHKTALRHLLEIYQQERDWNNAIAVGQELVPKRRWLRSGHERDQGYCVALSHFYCEKAEQANRRRDFQEARAELKRALSYDSHCVRASIMLGRIELEEGNYGRAIKAFKRVFSQDRLFFGEVLELLHTAYRRRGEELELISYLMHCYEEYPSTSVLLKLVELLETHHQPEQAQAYLAEQLRRRPTLRGLLQILHYQAAKASDGARENLLVLQKMLSELLAQKSVYQCDHCGFSGNHMHWMCPSCKHWGRTSPIRGAEGD